MVLYLEILNIHSLLKVFLSARIRQRFSGQGALRIYYFDAASMFERWFMPLLRRVGLKIQRLDFKMCEIKDEYGELIRIRIHRKDLNEIRQKITKTRTYHELYHITWKQGRIKDYISKGLTDKGIMNKESVARILFMIQVVRWHMRQRGEETSSFCIEKRPWFDVYKEYALQYGIHLFESRARLNIFKKSTLASLIRRYPLVYRMIKNLKYRQRPASTEKTPPNPGPKLYVDGRGDFNAENNGCHSDFFWHLNSDFPRSQILYKHCSKGEEDILKENGIYSVGEGVVWADHYRRNYQKPRVSFEKSYKKEAKAIQAILREYHLERYHWGHFFAKYDIKVFLTWFKYNNYHMALADAIQDNGGVCAVWQMAYDGYENSECKLSADISFDFSNWSRSIGRRLDSNVQYQVIIGYPKDYVAPLLREEALDLRRKMQEKGAEKIVFVIDENSVDDERWHTGHGLQRENYSYILQKVLHTAWLGVIFKPKAGKTLRQRLGSVSQLLREAEQTGRCYVYESSGRYATSAPPILAGLSADLCIHGHLCSGTAALECALEGLPTLLIDREGAPYSKLYELPRGKVVFNNWSETLDAVMKYFKTPGGVPGFGDWSSMLGEFDPFRDGLAARRMGTYLHRLMQGFERGLTREAVMFEAAEQYAREWGRDKVLGLA